MSDLSELVKRFYHVLPYICAEINEGGGLFPDDFIVLENMADALTVQQAEIERLREALEDLRKNAALLKQSAEGCIVNHYAGDFAIQGMPGWLLDASASIERARAALTGKEVGDD